MSKNDVLEAIAETLAEISILTERYEFYVSLLSREPSEPTTPEENNRRLEEFFNRPTGDELIDLDGRDE
jgi:hypothetical protein